MTELRHFVLDRIRHDNTTFITISVTVKSSLVPKIKYVSRVKKILVKRDEVTQRIQEVYRGVHWVSPYYYFSVEEEIDQGPK